MSSEFEPCRKNIRRLRRYEASEYLKKVWGFDYAPRTLAKLACVGGGPMMEYAGRIPTYTEAALDDFAEARLSAPVANTSQRQAQRQAA